MTGVRYGMCELTRHGMGTAWYLRISLKDQLSGVHNESDSSFDGDKNIELPQLLNESVCLLERHIETVIILKGT
jgi:hypothetical protein